MGPCYDYQGIKFMQFDPESMKVREIYQLLVQLVVPRPIAWVSSISNDGVTNLAPYSFFNAVGANPPTLMFCPVNRRDGSFKDSLANVIDNGEFVVNVVSHDLGDAMVQTSADFDKEISEFAAVGIESVPSVCVGPPRVAKSLAQFECRRNRVIHLGEGPAGANIVIGDIVKIHVSDSVIKEPGKIDPEQLDAIGRMGGASYCRTSERFDISLQ